MRITCSLLLLCATSAFPSYRTKIPNGMERGDLSVVWSLGVFWIGWLCAQARECPVRKALWAAHPASRVPVGSAMESGIEPVKAALCH